MVHPEHFQVKLSSCGVSSFSGSYKIMKEKDGLDLLLLATHVMAKDFVGKDQSPTLKYHLACCLLNGINFPAEKLLKDIEDSKKFMGRWVHIPKEEAEKRREEAELVDEKALKELKKTKTGK